MSSTKSVGAVALAGIMALAVSACSHEESMVRCYGVSKKGPNDWVQASAGGCAKLANSRAEPLTPAEAKTIQPYPMSSYIKCYGVAAAGKNDCATNTVACGGSVSQAGDPRAWIAIPEPLCNQVKNGVVGKTNA